MDTVNYLLMVYGFIVLVSAILSFEFYVDELKFRLHHPRCDDVCEYINTFTRTTLVWLIKCASFVTFLKLVKDDRSF